ARSTLRAGARGHADDFLHRAPARPSCRWTRAFIGLGGGTGRLRRAGLHCRSLASGGTGGGAGRRRSLSRIGARRRACRTGDTRRRIGYRKRRRGRLLGLGERLLPCLPARQLVEGGTIAPYELRPLPVHALVQRHRTREQLLELLTVAFVPRCRRAVRRRKDRKST